ncbi:MAG: hypothetical protein ACJAWA_001506, partial [Nonlabens sp.]
GFIWRGDEMIATKEDLFKGKPAPILTPIKGIPLPEIEEDFFKQDKKLKINENSRLKEKDLKTRATDTPDYIRKKKIGNEG